MITNGLILDTSKNLVLVILFNLKNSLIQYFLSLAHSNLMLIMTDENCLGLTP